MLSGIRTGATVEGFSIDKPERRSITSAHCRLLAAALVVLGLTGVWTATASFGEPDQKGQKSGAASSASTEDKSEQLKQNQVSLKRSRVYTFVGKTGLGHQHGIEGQLKSGSIQLGAQSRMPVNWCLIWQVLMPTRMPPAAILASRVPRIRQPESRSTRT